MSVSPRNRTAISLVKATAILTAALCTVVTARADITLVQETDMMGLKSKTTMSIKGSKVRTDSGTETSVIIDTDSGAMTTLMHEQKMVMTVKSQDLPTAPETPAAAKTDMPKLVNTGKKEKVQGYDCEIVIWEVAGTKSTMWVAKAFPGYDKLKKELATMTKLSPKNAAPPKLDGMVLKTETLAGGHKFVTTFVSLKDDAVKDSLFDVPSGYKKVGE